MKVSHVLLLVALSLAIWLALEIAQPVSEAGAVLP